MSATLSPSSASALAGEAARTGFAAVLLPACGLAVGASACGVAFESRRKIAATDPVTALRIDNLSRADPDVASGLPAKHVVIERQTGPRRTPEAG